MHAVRVGALDEVGLVAVAAEQMLQLLVRDAGEDRRIVDLVAVQMQHRQHRAVANRVEELVGVPGGRQRPGLRLAVADHDRDDQVGIVERRAVGVRDGVAEFAALVDRAGRLRRAVAADPAREGELLEEPAQPFLVLGDIAVDLRVGAFEIDVGEQRRRAVAGSGEEDDVEVVLF